jgi:cephalosporin-C deacetylase
MESGHREIGGMLYFDLPHHELKTYKLPHSTQPDFDGFWERALTRSKGQPLDPDSAPHPYPIPGVRVEKVSYAAYDGGRIVGWSITPAEVQARPTLIFFHGYSQQKKKVADYLKWVLQGFTCLTFDVRGQCGESTDDAVYPSGQAPGWLTRGIMDPESYYLHRCYVDAVRAIDFAETRSEVDATRIGVTGVSQGGALTLAACSLDHRPRLCMPEVPAFCHFGRTLELTEEFPWTELIHYFRHFPDRVDQAMKTLSYVELNNFTEHIHCPTLMSVGHRDMICPPSTIFSAFNHLVGGEKQLEYFPYNEHESNLMIETMIVWARKYLLDEA